MLMRVTNARGDAVTCKFVLPALLQSVDKKIKVWSLHTSFFCTINICFLQAADRTNIGFFLGVIELFLIQLTQRLNRNLIAQIEQAFLENNSITKCVQIHTASRSLVFIGFWCCFERVRVFEHRRQYSTFFVSWNCKISCDCDSIGENGWKSIRVDRIIDQTTEIGDDKFERETDESATSQSRVCDRFLMSFLLRLFNVAFCQNVSRFWIPFANIRLPSLFSWHSSFGGASCDCGLILPKKSPSQIFRRTFVSC